MLHGIDISNWQSSISLAEVISGNKLDFVLCKATEGTSYVDKSCDKFVQTILKSDTLFGYYHFARNNDPHRECEFFIDMTEGYSKKGIPVLDIEDNQITDWKTYTDRFCTRYHDLTGIWPMIYISAGNIPRIRGCYAYNNCALWVAGYPKKFTNFSEMETRYSNPPYTLLPWSNWTLWQFTSSGKLKVFSGNLDLDVANLTRDGWERIAKGKTVSKPTETTPNPTPYKNITQDEALYTLAKHVIAGSFGNGAERKERIYSAVQQKVNEILTKG